MRTFLLSASLCLLAVPTVRAEKAPLTSEELEQEAELIVVGSIESLNIDVERSRYDPGLGNEDWAIDARIKVAWVEKGTWTSDHIDARCFRAKSRASLQGFVSPSGHRPIPDRGTQVRAYLRESGAGWEVVLPNGFSSPHPDFDLSDAKQIDLADVEHPYLLPIETWWLVVFLSVVIVLVVMIMRGRANRNGRFQAT
jgi:hypothetical protein